MFNSWCSVAKFGKSTAISDREIPSIDYIHSDQYISAWDVGLCDLHVGENNLIGQRNVYEKSLSLFSSVDPVNLSDTRGSQSAAVDHCLSYRRVRCASVPYGIEFLRGRCRAAALRLPRDRDAAFAGEDIQKTADCGDSEGAEILRYEKTALE